MARIGKKTAEAGAKPANRLRIIGGRWRGVPLQFPDVEGLRPTPDRVRETLFNWLQFQIRGARCLDLFAGSGALGIEALSRGAEYAAFVDREPRAGQRLTQTLARLGATANAAVYVEEAVRFLRREPQPFDVVFLDPPFASGLLAEACAALEAGWLAREAWVYIECPADAGLPALPAGWSVHRTKRAGQVGYHLL
ncbi:MAG TPA: 16S rRNA (guanine(966)-N(2))-methyltransferase RsmD, partial [Steroidobacter sp.]|nr:16S rRNA (guanine(966)-N(2))-methyltransferase RsmD [Steroidobacter sp.]